MSQNVADQLAQQVISDNSTFENLADEWADLRFPGTGEGPFCTVFMMRKVVITIRADTLERVRTGMCH